ncbi:MAG: hypothetical protein P4M14_13015 [Gammaproteobacteria bacterium]|nr:hypothetical protein [Gammaproteobacteria bacterium]
MRKGLSFLFFAICLNSISYATEAPPKAVVASTLSCAPIKSKPQDQNILLPGANSQGLPQLYLLKNISSKSVWLDHTAKKPSMSAGWSSYLRPGNGSAILLDKKDFSLTCSLIEPGKVVSLKCGQAISVCVAKPLLTKRKGSYWLIEDKPWNDLLTTLSKKVAK